MRNGRQSTEILCGITYLQIVDVACKGLSFQDSAKELGVSSVWLRAALKRRGMCHWFANRQPKRRTNITPEDIAKIAAEGYTTADAAHLLGIDRKTLWKYRKELEVSFPNSGVASWIHRRGYCG